MQNKNIILKMTLSTKPRGRFEVYISNILRSLLTIIIFEPLKTGNHAFVETLTNYGIRNRYIGFTPLEGVPFFFVGKIT